MSFATKTQTQIATPATQPAANADVVLQRKPEEEKKDIHKAGIQAKLTVGAPDDPYEKEADAVADKVMRIPDQNFAQRQAKALEEPAMLQRQTEKEDEQISLKKNTTTSFLQRKCAECEQEEKEVIHRKPISESITPLLQAKSEGQSIVSEGVATSLQASRGNGSNLDGRTQTFMSSRFGSDFSHVKIHVGSEAAELSSKLNAKAFTVGSDVYFNEGQYDPTSLSGKQLLAHELTHVVQQTGSVQTESFLQHKCSCEQDEKIQRQELDKKDQQDEEEVVQTKPLNNFLAIQRKCEECTKEEEVPLQRKAFTTGSIPFIQTKLNNASPLSFGYIQRQEEAATVTTTDSVCSDYIKTDVPVNTAIENTEPPPGETPPPPGSKSGTIQPVSKSEAATISKGRAEEKKLATELPNKKNNVPDDPAFNSVIKEAHRNAKKQKDHEDADVKVLNAEEAAKVKDEQAITSGAVVLAVDEKINEEKQKPKEFNADEFKKQLKEKISSGVPNEEGSAKAFIKDDKQVNAITADTKANVSKAQNEVVNDAKKIVSQNEADSENKSKIFTRTGTPYEAEQAGKKPVITNAERAVPKPVSQEETQMDEDHNADSLDKKMAENNLTDDQLAESEEPKFIDTLEEKQNAQKEICKVPGKLKAAEAAQLKKSSGDAQSMLNKTMGSMYLNRDGQLKSVEKGQSNVQSEEEIRLQNYYNKIKFIHATTELNVKNRLAYLDCSVSCTFEEAIAAAFETFKTHVTDRLEYYYDWHIVRADYEKEDKMTRAFVNAPLDEKIAALEYRKLFLKPNSPEIKELQVKIDDLKNKRTKLKIELIFEEEKALFISTMDTAIDNIANMVATGLNEAKAMISKGRAAVEEEYCCLDDANKEKAKETTDDFLSKFDDLDSKVDEKEGELSDSLARQYNETASKLKSTFEEIRQEASLRWWERAWRKIKEIALIIYDLGKTLFNILVKAASVIGDIIRHPIRFFENLIEGITRGFKNFVKRLPHHLEEVIFKIIMGVVPPEIKLPAQWDLKGIFSFVLDILGFSKENIRKQAVDRFGEPIVQKLEEGFELFTIFRNEGLAGLWEYIKEKIGNLKDAIIEEVKTFFKESIIQAAVEFLISALTPASGFIKVCKSIISIAIFLVKNLQNLLKLLDNILDSLADVAVGKVDRAAKKVENAITDILVIGIKFLAALIGINLDKIQAKVFKIINAVRNPVNRAIKWLFDKAEAFAKKSGLLKVIAKGKSKIKAGKKWVKQKVEKGKEKVKGAVAALVSWLGFKKSFKSKDGGKHEIFFKGSKQKPLLMVASEPTPVEVLLNAKKSKDSNANSAYQYYVSTVKSQEDKVLEKEKIYQQAPDKDKKRVARYKHQVEVQTLREKMKEFADLLSLVTFEAGTISTIRTKVEKQLSGNRAHIVKASPLTYLPGDQVGSSPSQDPPGWKNYAQNASDKWVRGHLLSEHLHGPGLNWNLVPVSQSVNSKMAGLESKVKPLLKDQTKVLFYRAMATYDDSRPDNNEKSVPTNIEINWGTLEKDDKSAGGYKEHPSTPLSERQSLPTLSGPPNINSVGWKTIFDNGITVHRLARDIVRCRYEFEETDEGFEKYPDLIDKLSKYYANQLKPKSGIYPEKWVKQDSISKAHVAILFKAIQVDKTLQVSK